MAKAGRYADQFQLRLPPGLRSKIAIEAEKSGRSMNGEIVHRIEKSLEEDGQLAELWEKVERLESIVEEIDRERNPLKYDYD